MNLRVVALGVALVLDGLLAVRLVRARPDVPVRLHGVAPPLVHVPGAGEDTILAPETTAGAPPDALQRALAQVVQAQGTPAQRQALAGMDARRATLGPSFDEGNRLRVAVADDAADLVHLVGTARAGAFLDAREALSERWAEGRAWRDLLNVLRETPAPTVNERARDPRPEPRQDVTP